MEMAQIIVILLLIAMCGLTYIIFKKGMRQSDPEAENCMKGCMGCGAAEFCSDVKRFSKLAEEQAAKKSKA
jgi:hypothetical protein